jgi:hypothetical protein
MVVRIKLVAADSEAEIERIQFLLAMYNMLRYELYKQNFIMHLSSELPI